jgi:ATP-dependent DNA helicase 2 subunit 2
MKYIVELILMTRNTGTRKKTSLRSRFVHTHHNFESSLTCRKKNNEATLQELVEMCDGTYGTAAAAIDYLSTPEVKTTRPYSSYRGKLSLGDWQKYEETALYIDVIRYFKTKQRKPDSASNFVSRSTNGAASGQSSHTLGGDVEMADAPPSGSDFAAVKNERKYTVNAVGSYPDVIDGKKLVERDELAKGYLYGRTAVPISESEENITKLETFSEFTIIGFIPWDKVYLKTFHPESLLLTGS